MAASLFKLALLNLASFLFFFHKVATTRLLMLTKLRYHVTPTVLYYWLTNLVIS